MTAEYEFAKSGSKDAFETRILGDWDDPAALVQRHPEQFRSSRAKPRVALSDKDGRALGRRACKRLLPDARFLSATDYPAPAARHQERGVKLRCCGAPAP